MRRPRSCVPGTRCGPVATRQEHNYQKNGSASHPFAPHGECVEQTSNITQRGATEQAHKLPHRRSPSDTARSEQRVARKRDHVSTRGESGSGPRGGLPTFADGRGWPVAGIGLPLLGIRVAAVCRVVYPVAEDVRLVFPGRLEVSAARGGTTGRHGDARGDLFKTNAAITVRFISALLSTGSTSVTTPHDRPGHPQVSPRRKKHGQSMPLLSRTSADHSPSPTDPRRSGTT